MPMNNTPDPVDTHVGSRIRVRRKQLGMSQTALADALGLTFQQVQKYERGSNRVSASMLFKTSKKLTVAIDYFFVGLEGQEDSAEANAVDVRGAAAIAAVPELAAVTSWPRDRQRLLSSLIPALTGPIVTTLHAAE